MASLLRLREPFAVILLVALGLRVLAAAVQVPFYARSIGSVPEALLAAGSAVTNPVVVLAAGAAAIWCAWPRPTPHARTLLLLTLIAAGVSTVGATVVTIARLTASGPIRFVGFAESVTLLAVALVTVAALFAALRDLPAAYADRPAAAPGPPGPPAPPAVPSPPAVAPPDPATRPTWAPDQASGAVWRTAGEAASGAPAAHWDPGADATHGWHPIPSQNPQQDPQPGGAPPPRTPGADEPRRDP